MDEGQEAAIVWKKRCSYFDCHADPEEWRFTLRRQNRDGRAGKTGRAISGTVWADRATFIFTLRTWDRYGSSPTNFAGGG